MLPQTIKKWEKRKMSIRKKALILLSIIFPCKSSKQKLISFGVDTYTEQSIPWAVRCAQCAAPHQTSITRQCVKAFFAQGASFPIPFHGSAFQAQIRKDDFKIYRWITLYCLGTTFCELIMYLVYFFQF